MRKDYTLAEKDHLDEEIAFVEDFWTRRWESHDGVPEADALTGREEYAIMAPLLAGLPRGARILDGGCGLGEWTVFLTDRGFDVVGMDISELTIARLQALFPAYQFTRGDIRATGLTPASFDAYFSWGTFEHFENGPGDCINEAYRVLKPGGLLWVTVPFQNWRILLREASPRYNWRQAYDLKPGYPWPMRFYQWRFTRADLRQELEMRGFTILELIPIHRDQGLQRALVWDFGLTQGTRRFRLAERLLRRLTPTRLVAHMLMAVCRKPVTSPGEIPDVGCSTHGGR
jgi:SAM-dependent methyltransferase